MANKYVTEEALKQVGKTGEPRTYEVERGAIRRFAEAIGDDNPIFNSDREARNSRFGGMIAPPTFYRSLMAPVPEVKLDMPTSRGLDGGSDWEYFKPARPGDRITVQTKIAGARKRRPPRSDDFHYYRDQLHRISSAKSSLCSVQPEFATAARPPQAHTS